MTVSPTMALEEFTERDPWERLEGEPTNWYDRFTMYRLIGPNRSLRKAYKQHRAKWNPDPLKSTQGAPNEWTRASHQWHWKQRAEAWDDDVRNELQEIAHRELTEGYALAHERVKALKAIAVKLDAYLLDPKNNRLSPSTLEQYRGLLDDIAREVGHRIKETRLTGAGGGPVVIETQWGRGGSATNAWEEKQSEVTVSEVEEGEIHGSDG